MVEPSMQLEEESPATEQAGSAALPDGELPSGEHPVCGNCGAEIRVDDVICPKCGIELVGG